MNDIQEFKYLRTTADLQPPSVHIMAASLMLSISGADAGDALLP